VLAAAGGSALAISFFCDGFFVPNFLIGVLYLVLHLPNVAVYVAVTRISDCVITSSYVCIAYRLAEVGRLL